MKTKQDVHELLRWMAVSCVCQGHSCDEVAETLGVSRASVYRWWAAYQQDGEQGLRDAPRPGRPRKLTGEQEAQVLEWLNHDATAFGFTSSRWTAPRLSIVIEREFGVRFNPRYLNQWLSQRKISPQIPQPVARERRQDEVDRWVAHDWPRIKKTPTAGEQR
ncbi:MAG: IS630 family transposase [Planctomycetes bacterium]|nr:IS630 family transposase [Planctomycetota bacterium]